MKPEKIKIAPQWGKTKEDIWAETFADLEEGIPAPAKVKRISIWRYAAVAVVVFAVTAFSASFFYSVTEITARGTHLAVVLPDASKVMMNADSKLSYKPIWWFVSRKVQLDGEAYFEVKHGTSFSVVSESNEVAVLGTSFNVFSRPERYSVTCLTGKVQVTTGQKNSILIPGMQLTSRDGKITLEDKIDGRQSIGWTKNKFVFVGVPLTDVVREVERQYDILIMSDAGLNHRFTGNFTKTENPGEVLDIIGSPFGIKLSYKKNR
jgi:ferric-dicitrate binding protein FerR (iron transport regulator)